MKISIVTPSLNQEGLLRGTMNSVLQQEACDLEYIVVDGGSIDGSRDVIESQAARLAWWVSEPDGGHYAAVNKGFAHATGEVLGWLNASDLFTPWTLATVADVFANFPEVQWLTSLRPMCVDERGRFAGMPSLTGFTREGLVQGRFGLPGCAVFIQQESTFWRRGLWEAAGAGIPKGYPLAGDLALWAAFFEQAPLFGLDVPLAAFRFHANQRSHSGLYGEEALRVVRTARARPVVPHQRKFGTLHVDFQPQDRSAAWKCVLNEGNRPAAPDGESSDEGHHSLTQVYELQAAAIRREAAIGRLAMRLAQKDAALAKSKEDLKHARSALKQERQREARRVGSKLKRWWRRLRNPAAAEENTAARPPATAAGPAPVPAGNSPAEIPRRRIWVAHHSDCENIGDRACNPLQFLPAPAGLDFEFRSISLASPDLAGLDGQTIILGGGGSLNPWCRDKVLLPLLVRDNDLVAWGIGHHHDQIFTDANGRKDTQPWSQSLVRFADDYAFLRHFGLVGLRDFGSPWPYLPCPTCLHPAFDHPPSAPEHEAVVYEHAVAGSIPIDEYPKRNNHGTEGVAEIARFLASGRTVITNSFHGAYWALLLGRAVLIFEPWCSKFLTFREPLTVTARHDWRDRLHAARSIPGYLDECRRLNHDFAKRFWSHVTKSGSGR